MSSVRLVAAALLALSVPGLAQTKTQVVSVNVHAEEPGGKPVNAARVIVYTTEGVTRNQREFWFDGGLLSIVLPPLGTGETAADGNARVDIPVKDGVRTNVIVEVSAEGHVAQRKSTDIDLSRPAGLPFSFSLAPKPVGGDEESVRVRVRVTEDAEGGGSKPIAGATVTATSGGAEFSATTDETGFAFVVVPYGRLDYDLVASKLGYEGGPKAHIRFASGSMGKTVTATPLTVSRGNGATVTVTVTDDSDAHRPVAGAHVSLTGSSLASGDTDGSGKAVIYVRTIGAYTIAVSQDTYDPGGGLVHVRYGEPEAAAAVQLHEKPHKADEEIIDEYTVTVLGVDKDNPNGPPQPVPGARVVDGNAGFTTGLDGVAVVTGKHDPYIENVPFVVSANGYASKSANLKLSRPLSGGRGTGSTTVTLAAGDADSQTPLQLTIAVTDAHLVGISGADVVILDPNGAGFSGRLIKGQTNGAGEMALNSAAINVPVDDLRNGLKLTISHAGYVTTDSQVAPQFLKPQIGVQRYSVVLSRAWDELRQAVDQLQALVSALTGAANALSTGAVGAGTVQRAVAAEADAESRGRKIVAAYLKIAGGDVPRTMGCSDAQRIAESIKVKKAEAAAKEAAIASALEKASTLAEVCAVPSDGVAARQLHREALSDHLALRLLLTTATSDANRLRTFTEELSASKDIIDQIRGDEARLAEDDRIVVDAARESSAAVMQAAAGAAALNGQSAAVQAQLGVARQRRDEALAWLGQEAQPANLIELNARLEALVAQFTAARARIDAVSNAERPPELLNASETVHKAFSAVQAAKSGAAEICSVDGSADLKAIQSSFDDASGDLALFSGVPALADDCAARRPKDAKTEPPSSGVDPSQNQEGGKDPKGSTDAKTPSRSTVDPSQNQDGGEDPKGGKGSADPKKKGRLDDILTAAKPKIVDALKQILEAKNQSKAQPPAGSTQDSGTGAPPGAGPDPPPSGGPPPGDAGNGAFGDLTGTWEWPTTDANNCTVWMVVTLHADGSNTWTGDGSWRDSGCANPYGQARFKWRVVATAAGVASVSLSDQTTGQSVNQAATFTATTLTIAQMNATFTRK